MIKKHTYVKQVLQDNNFKIYRGGVRILVPDQRYNFPPLTSYYETGRKYFEQGEITTINIEELYNLGFVIVKESSGGLYNTRVTYKIVKASKMVTAEKRVPQNHQVQLDLHNSCVRLKGKNSGSLFGLSVEWIKINRKSNAGQPEKLTPEEKRKREILSIVHSHLPFKVEKLMNRIDLSKEIPFMISYDHKIVCLEKRDTAPIIGFLGLRRSGNSFIKHRIVDQAHQKWGIKIASINDKMGEYPTWSMAWEKGYSIPKIGDVNFNILNEHTIPMPIVLLYQETNELKNDFIKFNNDIGFKISMSFEELMEHYSPFYKDDPDMKMNKTDKVFRIFLYDDEGNLKKNSPILKAKGMKDINAFFDSIKSEGKKGAVTYIYEGDELPDKSISKLKRIFLTIMSYRMVDISSGTPSKWSVEFPNGRKQEMTPLLACLTADLVPVLETGHIANKEWFPFWFRKLLEDLYINQTQNKYFIDNQFELWVDTEELLGIIGQVGGKAIDDTFDKIIRESGLARLGLLFRSQEYLKLTKTMINQWGYYFCTRMKKEEAVKLCKDTAIPDEWAEIISHLQRFEMVAIPNNTYNHFVTYDIDGTRRIEDKPFHGRMLPPNSQHMPPKHDISKEENEEEVEE